MSGISKYTAFVFSVLAAVAGALLLVIPGRFLDAVGWTPVEPIFGRFFGAALLAFAWGAWRAWQTRDTAVARFAGELGFLFCALAVAGALRHLLIASYSLMVWGVMAVFALFAILWLVAFIRS